MLESSMIRRQLACLSVADLDMENFEYQLTNFALKWFVLLLENEFTDINENILAFI